MGKIRNVKNVFLHLWITVPPGMQLLCVCRWNICKPIFDDIKSTLSLLAHRQSDWFCLRVNFADLVRSQHKFEVWSSEMSFLFWQYAYSQVWNLTACNKHRQRHNLWTKYRLKIEVSTSFHNCGVDILCRELSTCRYDQLTISGVCRQHSVLERYQRRDGLRLAYLPVDCRNIDQMQYYLFFPMECDAACFKYFFTATTNPTCWHSTG